MPERIRNLMISASSLIGYKITEEKWIAFGILGLAITIGVIFWYSK